MSPRPVRNKELGEFVRAHRTAKGWSLRYLAEVAGVDVSFVSLLEAGRIGSVSSDRLARLGKALNANMADLFSLAGYTLPTDAPSLGIYLRRSSPDLPEAAVKEMEAYFDEVRRRHRAGRSTGPKPGEDEQ